MSNRFSQLGASMLEMAFLISITLFMLIVILDAGRYFAVRATMTKGAQEGLNLATKAQNIDLSSTDANYATKYKGANGIRQQVINTALRLPLNIVTPSTVSSAQKLIAVKLENGSKVDAILIRPGERFETSDGTKIDHPSLCKDNTTSYCNLKPVAQPGQPMKTRLEQHPLLVEARATFRPFLPFLQPITVRGVAIGFREQVNISGFGVTPTTTTTTSTTTSTTTTTSSTTSSTTSTSTSTSSTTSTTSTTTSSTSTTRTSTTSTSTSSTSTTSTSTTTRTTSSTTTSSTTSSTRTTTSTTTSTSTSSTSTTSTSRTTTSTTSTTSTTRTTTSTTSTTTTSRTTTSTTTSTTTTTLPQCQDVDGNDDDARARKCLKACKSAYEATGLNNQEARECAENTFSYDFANAPDCCTCLSDGICPEVLNP